ncbi:SRPBCC family protein [Streptomyces sp. NPDC058001]|uniref:SRPBCC family protein n=1 Tax=Streptomyces sp. NPDC058001 TaxID=3346300 RepID=UPI0036ED0D9C
MTETKDDNRTRDETPGLDLLKEELVRYLGARMDHTLAKAGDSLTGATGQLLDIAENGGALPKAATRILGGESPLKAIAGEKLKGLMGGLLGKTREALGGKGGGRSGTTKVTSIIESLDVGLPIRAVYDHWTEYEKFSGFTKGVRHVSQEDEITTNWKAKVGPSTRGWKATITEQVPDERVAWTSEGAKGTTHGCVSFHELTPTLTRVVLVVEYYPSGFFEKTGNLWRAQGRRLRLDFKHFQRYATLTSEEAEGWRGEIRDGEVVRTHEEAVEEEEAEAEDADEDDQVEDDAYADEDEVQDVEEEYDEEEVGQR